MRFAKAVRVIALVLGSAWFIPVSCTTGGVGIAHLSAYHSEAPWAQAVQRDPNLRKRFHVVALPGAQGAAFRALTLLQVEESERGSPAPGFLMGEEAGQMADEANRARYRYRVLARSPAEQVVEVEFSDGDNHSISRYRATASQVAPIAWRYGPLDQGISMAAFASGFVLALVLYLSGMLLRWFLRRAAAAPA